MGPFQDMFERESVCPGLFGPRHIWTLDPFGQRSLCDVGLWREWLGGEDTGGEGSSEFVLHSMFTYPDSLPLSNIQTKKKNIYIYIYTYIYIDASAY